MKKTEQDVAQNIMGTNFFGIEKTIECLCGMRPPTREQEKFLEEIPFSEDVLYRVQKSHLLVVSFPCYNFFEILQDLDRREYAKREERLLCEQSLNDKNLISIISKESRNQQASWSLIRKNLVKNSTSKNFEDQIDLLKRGKTLPSISIMVLSVIGHYLATNERIFGKKYARTSSLNLEGGRLSFGGFKPESGLIILPSWDDEKRNYLGIPSAWMNTPQVSST